MRAPVVIHGAAIVAGDEAGTIHHDAGLAVDNGRVALIASLQHSIFQICHSLKPLKLPPSAPRPCRL